MMKFLPHSTILLLALTLTLGFATSARVLDEVDPQPPVVDPTEDSPALPPLVAGTSNSLPSGSTPASSDAPAEAAAGGSATTDAPADQPPQDAPAGTTGQAEHPTISFYMHDVLGGTQASGRIVTGIIATTQVNGIPFSVPNNQVFPVTNGVPLNNNNVNNLINNNNAPFLASLNGQNPSNPIKPQTVFQNAGTNTVVNGGGNNQAFVTPGQLPAGASLQKLMFGSITVFDDELTEGHELGSGVMGKGQGFYLASSLDGESHTMAFTAVFHSEGEHHDEVGDTLSFFGVHRTASPISQIAIIGGTGKYEYAQGYATIETLPPNDQHTTDGVDTIAHISVYLTQ